MADTIEIRGTFDDVCSCIDFYQNMSTVGLLSIDDLRKSYISTYLEDYKVRFERVKKLKAKRDAEESTEKEIEEEVKEETKSVENDEDSIDWLDDSEDSVDWLEMVPDSVSKTATDDKKDEKGTDVKSVKTVNDSADPEVPAVRDGSGTKIERNPTDSEASNKLRMTAASFFSNLKKAALEEKKLADSQSTGTDGIEISPEQYVPNGIMIEDYVAEGTDTAKSVAQPAMEEPVKKPTEEYDWVEDVQYVKNGTMIEDVPPLPEAEEADEDRVSETSKNGTNSVEETTNDTDTVGVSKQVPALCYVPNGVILEDLVERVPQTEVYYEDKMDSRSNVGTSDTEKIKTATNSRTVKNRETKRNQVKREKVKTEKTVETDKTYKSVRDYVKQNSGCERSDILKYFSKRDIEKALMSAKIVQKKKKYYAV